MASTPLYAFPAPDHPEDADGPEQILALAAAVEALLSTGVLKMSTGTIEAADPTSARHPVTKAWFDARILFGPEGSVPASLPVGSIYFGYTP
jgi:hypothetical protein